MGGLFGALQTSLNTLSNMQRGISVVNENVANVNTEGYSRRRVIFSPGPVQVTTYGVLGSGAEIDRIQSIRDVFVEARILAERQNTGFYLGQQFGVTQLETIVAGADGARISDQLSRFFDSFLDLASDPSSASLRQVVIAEGGQLAWSIKNTASQLATLDAANQQLIEDTVRNVNDLLARIGQLNQKLVPILNQGQDGGSLYDERQLLLSQLSEQLGVQVQVDESSNMVISTHSGRLLLVGSDVYALGVTRTDSGATVVHRDGDLSDEIGGGRLGGLLSFQNSTLQSAHTAINELAAHLVSVVNEAHGNGFDLDGNAGGDFFTANAGQEARTIAMALSDYRTIAAAGPGVGIGEGSNAQALADLRDLRVPGLGDQTLRDFYSQIVFDAGLASRGVQTSLMYQDKILRHLEAQRESVSGVSLDEEAMNLLQYQRSYQASARLIRVLDQLIEETIALIR
jgi:flagellar hook-associated protein 1